MGGPHILMVSNRFFPIMGGLESHMYEVGRRLIRAGLNVSVLTTDLSGKLPVTEDLEGMQITRVPAYPRSSDLYIAPRLPRAIEASQPDLVHCQGCHSFVPPFAMATAIRRKIPFVLTFHSGGHSSRVRSAFRGVQWAAQIPLFRHADRLIAVSAFEASYFRQQLRLPSERFALIPNGGSLPMATDTFRNGEVRSDAFKDASGPLVLSVGRLERFKGHHRVLGAFSVVHEQIPEARLLIVGSGPEESRLRREIKKTNLASCVDITSVSPGDRAQMARLLSRASLVTLLSEYEAHPVSVMEALALGRPTLVADNSGMKELADKGWAKSVSLKDSDRSIGYVMVEQLLHSWYPDGVELPTWEACASKLHELYFDVLANHSLLPNELHALKE